MGNQIFRSEVLDLRSLKNEIKFKAEAQDLSEVNNIASEALDKAKVNTQDLSEVNTKASEALDKANQALQSGVSAKNGLVQAINSKVTVPDISESANWDTIITSVSDIKEGRGNAQTSHVLSGQTFTNDSGQMLTGSMPNRGGSQTITPSANNIVLNSGYYSGSITVSGDADLIAANIVSGKNIFGVSGTAKSIDQAVYEKK